MTNEDKLMILFWSMYAVLFIVVFYIVYGDKIKMVWKNKWKILEGIWNTWFPNAYVERVAAERNKICFACVWYDKRGEAAACFVKGSPCCGACGCDLVFKQRALSAGCIKGYWNPVLSQEEEDSFREKHKLVND